MLITLQGEDLILHRERAVHWPARGILFVADLHLGKAATFAAAGVPVPARAMSRDLARLSACISATEAKHLVILGDLFHARHAHQPAVKAELAAWRAAHTGLRVTLIRGNHDRAAGDPDTALRITTHAEPHRDPTFAPFTLAHEPPPEGQPRGDARQDGVKQHGYVLCGHIHPGITIAARSGASLRAPCFVVGTRRLILPAFGVFTGLARPPRDAGDTLIAIADELVPLSFDAARV